MRAAWLSDIHLTDIAEDRALAFCEKVREHECDSVFLTGDISESPVLLQHLKLLDANIQKPIYFVLGNHDFWYSSVPHIYNTLPQAISGLNFVRWMTNLGPLRLDDGVCVVGHDGWYDCRAGDVRNSRFIMPEWSKQQDYQGSRTIDDIIEKSQAMSNLSITHFKKVLPDAIARFDKIYILTHVPPFEETHYHGGVQGTPHYQPYFVNKILGELLRTAASLHPRKQFVVLAGHSHGRVSKTILPNLTVHVAGAQHGAPEIQPFVFT
jgi:predicted phosphohydrolase